MIPNYQSYYQNNYQNNPYSNYFQPQQQIPQMQQIQAPRLAGKLVNGFEEVTANDVPMDGNIAAFIKNDGTEIQLRAWKPDGTIATTRFKPILEQKVEDTTPNEQNAFYDDFKQFKTDIFERLDRLDKSKSTARTKKEVEAE